MKFRILILTLPFLLVLNTSSYAQCDKSEYAYSKELITEFATNADWVDVRLKVGLTNISTKDIYRLSTSYNRYSCTRLSNLVQNTFDKYIVNFYKIKDKYVIVTVLKQPEDPNQIAVGLSFLEIYNSSYTRIEGYSF